MLPLKALLAQHLHFWIIKPKGHTRVSGIASKISMQMSFCLATDVRISGSLRHFHCQHLLLSKTLNVTSGVTLEPAPNILGTEVLTVNNFKKVSLLVRQRAACRRRQLGSRALIAPRQRCSVAGGLLKPAGTPVLVVFDAMCRWYQIYDGCLFGAVCGILTDLTKLNSSKLIDQWAKFS